MKSLRNLAVVGAGLLGTTVAATQPCFANETLNNVPPWNAAAMFHPDVTMFIAENGSRVWGAPESISPTGDVDYLVVSCAKTTLKTVSIHFFNTFGDIDMSVFTLGGTLVGTSNGTSDNETLNVSAQGKNALVLKVYGFAGATNPYDITITCN